MAEFLPVLAITRYIITFFLSPVNQSINTIMQLNERYLRLKEDLMELELAYKHSPSNDLLNAIFELQLELQRVEGLLSNQNQ